MCIALGVSENAYYSWKKTRPDKKTAGTKERLKERIGELFEESGESYGAPRISEVLVAEGFRCGKSYAGRLMREMGVKVRAARRFVATTDSEHPFPIAPNLLERDFTAAGTGEKWVSDITYVKAGEEWAYLTTMIDLADRKVVGWSLSTDMTAENTVIAAWADARSKRGIKKGFILHSDRGVQYACNKVRAIFEKNGHVSQSMSRKGDCWDNAVAESFFKTIKYECLYKKRFGTFEDLYAAVFNYIENWYNTRRLHSSLGYKTPLQKEMELNDKYVKTKQVYKAFLKRA